MDKKVTGVNDCVGKTRRIFSIPTRENLLTVGEDKAIYLAQRLIAVTFFLLIAALWPSVADADLEVLFKDASELPYSLGPSKYSNSSSKYSNTLSKYSNSNSKYSNSSSKYDNSPSKYSNSKLGDQRLLLRKSGGFTYIGYYSWGDDGLLNFFSKRGDRLFYSPPETEAIFDAEEGEFSGTLAEESNKIVLVVTEAGQLALAKNGIPIQGEKSYENDPQLAIYRIAAAHNDETFIINGEKFEAKTYCLSWEVGEQILFVDGNPNGVCVTATLVNVDRNETCEVWCE